MNDNLIWWPLFKEHVCIYFIYRLIKIEGY